MILKTEKNANYTTLCNIALNDPELSLKAKGLFAFLMSKPTDWKISYRGLMTQLKEGQWAILGALKELEQAGYLQRDLEQSDDGQLYVVSVLREQPVRGKLTHGKNSGRTVRRKPTHGKPTRGKPTPIVTTEKLNTDKEKELEIERAAGDHRGEHSPAKERLRKQLAALKAKSGLVEGLGSSLDAQTHKDATLGDKTRQERAVSRRSAVAPVQYSGRTPRALVTVRTVGDIEGDRG